MGEGEIARRLDDRIGDLVPQVSPGGFVTCVCSQPSMRNICCVK